MSNNYIVYMHIAPNNKKYIGITGRPVTVRWQSGYGYHTQPKFYRAIQKYGWENFKHEILASNLSLEEAYKKEQDFIKLYDSFNNGYNADLGGGGAEGHKCSKEAKQKMRIAKLGKVSKKRGQSTPMLKIYIYDIEKAKIEFEYFGYLAAAEALESKRSTLINSCNNGTIFNKKYLVFNSKNIELLEERVINAKKQLLLKQKFTIFQFDLNGNFIEAFVKYKDAAEKTGLPIGSIGKSCSGIDLHVHNYFFLKTNNEQEIKKRVELLKQKNKIKNELEDDNLMEDK